MKKNKKYIIIGIVIGIIMMSGVGVVAAIFNAEDISFTPNDSSWEVTNVKEAMDSLYEAIPNNKFTIEKFTLSAGTNFTKIYTNNTNTTQNILVCMTAASTASNNNYSPIRTGSGTYVVAVSEITSGQKGKSYGTVSLAPGDYLEAMTQSNISITDGIIVIYN